MKNLSRIKVIFMIVGVCMIGGAGYLAFNTYQFLNVALLGKGEVIDLVSSRSSESTTYAPVVSYKIQSGETFEFTSSISSSPPSYSVGEKVDVLYLASEPQNAKIKGFFSLWGFTTIVGGFGAIFFSIGGGMMLFGFLKGKSEAHLREHGTPVNAEYKGVELNTSLSVNGRNPFIIITHWLNPSTNELFIFKSSNLWFDPSDYIDQNQITVYVDKENPKKYFVDTSFLPTVSE